MPNYMNIIVWPQLEEGGYSLILFMNRIRTYGHNASNLKIASIAYIVLLPMNITTLKVQVQDVVALRTCGDKIG